MKFWKVIRWLCPGLNRNIRHLEDRLLKVSQENDALVTIGERRNAPMSDIKLAEIMSTAADQTIWSAVLELIDRQAAIETDATLLPNLSTEARIFNAGRAAAIRDFEVALVQYQSKAASLSRG